MSPVDSIPESPGFPIGVPAGPLLVYATTANTSGHWIMHYLSFRDWKDAAHATPYYLDQSVIGTGCRAAPQLFYCAPQHLWYLEYQTGVPSYSTTIDPTKPDFWSAPKNFMNSMPDLITENIGSGVLGGHGGELRRGELLPVLLRFSSDDNGRNLIPSDPNHTREQTAPATPSDPPTYMGDGTSDATDWGQLWLAKQARAYGVRTFSNDPTSDPDPDPDTTPTPTRCRSCHDADWGRAGPSRDGRSGPSHVRHVCT